MSTNAQQYLTLPYHVRQVSAWDWQVCALPYRIVWAAAVQSEASEAGVYFEVKISQEEECL